MIHYTILPEELIFYDPRQQTAERVVIQIDGVPMLVEQHRGDQAAIVQLLSPNPQDYLNPRFQPGTPIRLIPKI
ncbi:YlzJ-like protein [Seinonella peptonophila]|uniref:YlzJ-like protein n=1 Tax=Seinonella peptonophila TaxID=112248 RepID=A0A1M4TBU3_9BACL|nr:YlzJ-like family protein [Seinonella peptonophila]SHE41926.1 YlzJ-like protein [Seinonella peptonophila]